jgi:hypothetical protein
LKHLTSLNQLLAKIFVIVNFPIENQTGLSGGALLDGKRRGILGGEYVEDPPFTQSQHRLIATLGGVNNR